MFLGLEYVFKMLELGFWLGFLESGFGLYFIFFVYIRFIYVRGLYYDVLKVMFIFYKRKLRYGEKR